MKHKSLTFVLVALLLFGCFVYLGPLDLEVKGAVSWGQTDYSFRKEITINQTAGASNLFQVNFTLYYGSGSDSGNSIYFDSNIKDDFEDIVFTRSNGASLMDYWLTDIITVTSCKAWVEVIDNVGFSNVTIFVYYGYASGSSSSSKENTFIEVIEDVVLALPCDEGTGITAYDKSGYGNDGTLGSFSGTINFTENGRYNSALNFTPYSDGDYLLVWDADSLSFADSFTWLLWANYNKTYWGAGQEWASFFSKNDFYYEYWWTLLYGTPMQSHARLADQDTTPTYDFIVGPELLQWNHYAYRWNSTYLSLFRNGTYQDGSAWATGFGGSTQTQVVYFGCVSGGNYAWEGILDEMFFVNASLTDAEISNCYAYYSDSEIVEGEIIVRKWSDAYSLFSFGEQESQPEDTPAVADDSGLAFAVVGFSLAVVCIGLIFVRTKKKKEE